MHVMERGNWKYFVDNGVAESTGKSLYAQNLNPITFYVRGSVFATELKKIIMIWINKTCFFYKQASKFFVHLELLQMHIQFSYYINNFLC